MRRMWTTLALAGLLAGNALAAGAQERRERRPAPPSQLVEEELVVAQSAERSGGGQIGGDTLVYLSTEMSFGGKVVKGAPYSAQAVTETVQTLGDGNRIVRKNSASVYRDSEGRTRRDQTLAHLGPFATAGDAAETSFINDPVSGVNYILEPRSKTARKLPSFAFHFRTRDREPAEPETAHQRRMKVEQRVKVEEGEAAAHGFVFTAPAPPAGDVAGEPGVFFFGHPSKAETKTEKLEKRVVEGVEAEGRRTLTTIAAGEIGNEQPIQIVHERWYSPELQLIVMTRHSDPRFGETTYRLTNINRGEPAASLFQVPGDYTLRDGPAAPRGPRRMRRNAAPPSDN